MNANKHELLLQKENCLCVEFRLRNISYNQQERHQVLYKGELVGE